MIIKHVKPPVQDKLKAHYFDRYANTFDGNKLLSSVGDQSEGREIQPGRCYDFDGVDDYVVTNNTIDIFDGDDFYAECYFMTRDAESGLNQALFGQHFLHGNTNPEENPPRFGLLVNGSGKIVFQYGTGVDGKIPKALTSNVTVESNRFYHVKVELIGTDLKMYLDGEQVASTTASDIFIYNDHLFYIGRSPSDILHPHHFNGKIFGIKIYSYTKEKYLVFFKCDESTGINTYDSSGNGYHGTITNASLETFHSTQDIYSWQNEVGYSEDVSPVGGFELSNDNWVNLSGTWIFTGTEAIHTSFGPTTQPVYFNPRELNLVIGVEYAITMTIEETNGMVGFSVYGGIPSNARRNTPGQIVSKFISDGQKIRCFTYENVDCIISDISVVAIGLVPALNDKVDIYGGELHYKGQVAYNALLKQSNCLYLDGIDDIIQFSDTTGWDRLENAGTSELSINGNNIEGTEGSVYNLRVYDSSDNLIHLFPCSEGGGTIINCVLGGTIGTLVNATLETVWSKQDEYHFNLEHGWSIGTNDEKIPASLTNHNQDATGLPLENIAGRHHNGAETLIDFTGGVESPYAVQFELPNNYAFGDPIEYKEEGSNREKNILIYEDVDPEEETIIKNFIKDI